ncbi:MAG: FKBP-type peptidyl-prolyl cis-trans isomerase, partial [Paramuribaculum sp.]|nr:FKBP-type peptidyl-prolyl cis-trans isomerase [Paramuribaculum sp.]
LKATDSEIKTTESGLSYKVITLGNGAVADKEAKDPVPVKYVGKHIDGTQFDSSNGETVKFPVNGVVKGFSEALTTFPAGSKVVLYMPADLAYGNQGNQSIEPGETLIFELEICEAEPAN